MRRQNTVAQYIAMQPILDLCERLVRRPRAWFSRRWWEQEGLDLAGVRERAEEVEDGEAEDREEERGGE